MNPGSALETTTSAAYVVESASCTPTSSTVGDEHALDVCLQHDPSPEPFEQISEGADEGARPADRVVDTPATFELNDEGVEGRGASRVTTDEQWMEGERLPEEGVPDAAVHEPVHVQHGPVLNEVRQHGEHDLRPHHRPFRVRVERVEDAADPPPQPLEPGSVRGASGGHLGEHGRLAGVVVERSALSVERAVERVECHQFHVVGQALAGEGEELLEHERRRQDRGTRVEAEAAQLVLVGPTADAIALLQHGHVVAGRGQTDGCGKSPEAAAHHNRSHGGHCRSDGRRPRPGFERLETRAEADFPVSRQDGGMNPESEDLVVLLDAEGQPCGTADRTTSTAEHAPAPGVLLLRRRCARAWS